MSLERQLADYGRLQEELFGPIAVDEITDQLADNRAGRTPSTQSHLPPRITRQAGPAWAVAAFAAVLAIGAVYLLFSNTGGQIADTPPPPTLAPDVETMTDLEVLHAGVEALYSGDAERAVELFGIEDGDDEAQQSLDDLIRREAAYQAAIGGRLTLDCTEDPDALESYGREDTPGMFTCEFQYHNALTDAVGYFVSPGVFPGDRIQVVVQDGMIIQFGYPGHIVQGIAHEAPEHNLLLRTVVDFLRKEVEAPISCWGGDIWSDVAGVRTPECARLIMDHLDEWADWYRTNGFQITSRGVQRAPRP